MHFNSIFAVVMVKWCIVSVYIKITMIANCLFDAKYANQPRNQWDFTYLHNNLIQTGSGSRN